MRLAVTIGLPHGGKKYKTISGPDVDLHDQVSEFKRLRASPTHPEFAMIQLWESGKGRAKFQRFTKGKIAEPATQTQEQQPEQ